MINNFIKKGNVLNGYALGMVAASSNVQKYIICEGEDDFNVLKHSELLKEYIIIYIQGSRNVKKAARWSNIFSGPNNSIFLVDKDDGLEKEYEDIRHLLTILDRREIENYVYSIGNILETLKINNILKEDNWNKFQSWYENNVFSDPYNNELMRVFKLKGYVKLILRNLNIIFDIKKQYNLLDLLQKNISDFVAEEIVKKQERLKHENNIRTS